MPKNELYGEHDSFPVEFTRADKLPNSTEFLPTGNWEIDDLLGGGIEVGKLTEVAGRYSSGKTQICFTVAVLNPDNTLYADTEGTFNKKRVRQIARERGLDDPLPRIFKDRMESSLAIDYWVHHRLEKMLGFKKYSPVKLVVIDSLISHYRAEYVGRESLAERQQKINALLHKLITLAEEHQFAVLFTNQAVASPSVFGGDKPTGGHIIAHASHYRLWLRGPTSSMKVGGKTTHILLVMDCSHIPVVERRFVLNERGFDAVEEREDSAGADTVNEGGGNESK